MLASSSTQALLFSKEPHLHLLPNSMYQQLVHSFMVHVLIYAVSVNIYSPLSYLLFHSYHLDSINWKKINVAAVFFADLLLCCTFVAMSHRSLMMEESGCSPTAFVFQTTTAATTVMKQAAVTPAQAPSLSVTAAAASRITGPATGTTTAATTAMRPTQTAPTRVGG